MKKSQFRVNLFLFTVGKSVSHIPALYNLLFNRQNKFSVAFINFHRPGFYSYNYLIANNKKDLLNLYAVKRFASLVKSGIKWFEECPYRATKKGKPVKGFAFFVTILFQQLN
jgi:hypothetical protein